MMMVQMISGNDSSYPLLPTLMMMRRSRLQSILESVSNDAATISAVSDVAMPAVIKPNRK